jgi:hypothetical protein
MTATDLASELQEHVLSVVQIAQEIVVSAVETGVEQAQRLLPEVIDVLNERLPNAPAAVNRAFVRTEEWLSSTR